MVEEKQDGHEPNEHPSSDELSLRSLSDRLAIASAGKTPLDTPVLLDELGEDFADYEQSEIAAGQMVVGSRVPAPKFAGEERKQALEGQTVFSSSANPPKWGLVRRPIFIFACIFAAGLAMFSLGLVESDDAGDGPAGILPGGLEENQSAQTTLLSTEVELSPPLPARNATKSVVSVSPIGPTPKVDSLSKPNTQLAQTNRASLTARDVSGDPDTDIPLQISVDQQDSREYAFIMFRGLPPEFSLSSGFRLKQSWAVSLKDLEDLKLRPSAGYTGEIELEVLLVQDRNTPVESGNITVRIGERTVPNNPVTTSAGPPDDLASVGPAARQRGTSAQSGQALPGSQTAAQSQSLPTKLLISPEQEAAMLERASQLLKNGDVVSARLLLEHIATKGSSKGAFALAKTYDPIAFSALDALGGVQADLEKAKKWYSFALQLGEEKARDRLTSLAR